jgi:hypothetical protein
VHTVNDTIVFKQYRQTPIFRHPFFGNSGFRYPLKIFGGMSKLGIYVTVSPVHNFNTESTLKICFPPVCYRHRAKFRYIKGFTNLNVVIQLSLTSTHFHEIKKTTANHLNTFEYPYPFKILFLVREKYGFCF